ncbi:CLUMA_CG004937, isoform A [Clunio marinus]|uniref:DNA repair nuclease/redox regulator APEX1 n=1 Tax=Clunio marinus TaxID=568069 RepID=A0A1J1HYR0_9DIPT|nr:CLUMA_CG004937, isoform A [Clunio marinus]
MAKTRAKPKEETPKTTPKVKKQITKKKQPSKPESKSLLNKVSTDYVNIQFGIDEAFNHKIVTWNVAGLRALSEKNNDYFIHEDADIICMNELKCGSEDDIPESYKLTGYHAYWNIKKGSSGVAILSKVKPLDVTFDLPGTEFEDEKRLITAEYKNFFLISVYVVNAGRGLKTLDRRLRWNEVFDDHVKKLDKKKPVIIAGDMNVSHQEIDLANPKTNKKSAGFTQEERDGFTELLSLGFVDTFRHFNPEEEGAYTYWTYMNKCRDRNVGWRLDYFLVSQRFLKHVKANVIRSAIKGSDHCPIVLFMEL